MYYLWRPNEREIEDYRISEYIESLKEYIRNLYGLNTIFEKYHSMMLVKEKWNDGGTYELGYITEIIEV